MSIPRVSSSKSSDESNLNVIICSSGLQTGLRLGMREENEPRRPSVDRYNIHIY
jgi:hypothetical protein